MMKTIDRENDGELQHEIFEYFDRGDEIIIALSINKVPRGEMILLERGLDVLEKIFGVHMSEHMYERFDRDSCSALRLKEFGEHLYNQEIKRFLHKQFDIMKRKFELIKKLGTIDTSVEDFSGDHDCDHDFLLVKDGSSWMDINRTGVCTKCLGKYYEQRYRDSSGTHHYKSLPGKCENKEPPFHWLRCLF